MTLDQYFGPPSEPCLSCGCPWTWTTTKGNPPMTLCAHCYPQRGTPPDVWVELKEHYSKRQVVTIPTNNAGYEALFDERVLHNRRGRRQPSSDDCYDGNLWEVQA